MSDNDTEAQAVTQMGSTFAERKAAREAFEKRRKGAKAVKGDDEAVEDKAVKSAAKKS